MEKQLDIIQHTQESFIKLVDSLTEEQFNKIPAGFGNNIIWNFAHILSALQMLCYGRAGLPLRLDEGFINNYKNGSKPEPHVSLAQYEVIKGYADSMLVKFKEDVACGVFNNFKPFTTMSGVSINNIEVAIQYVSMHHGMHLGYAMAMKKLLV